MFIPALAGYAYGFCYVGVMQRGYGGSKADNGMLCMYECMPVLSKQCLVCHLGFCG